MIYFRNLLLFFIFSASFTAVAQVQSLVLDWTGSTQIFIGDEAFELQTVKDFGLDNGQPFFALQQKHGNTQQEIEIITTSYVKLPKDQVQIYEQLGLRFQPDAVIDAKIVSDAGQPYLSFYILPLRYKDGSLERLAQLSYRVKNKTTAQVKDYASSSVLGSTSGKWYRIAVTKDGIYKIDKAFLEACGFNTTNLNPAHIHIFGNGEGVLPESNAVPITDDLAQNAILVNGEGDGTFDANDFVLFYAWGPHRWELSGGSQFNQVRHPYSDQSYYFIYIGSDIAPLRIASSVAIDAPADTLITNYDYRDVYENDLENLVKGGQRWYGEEFDVNLSQNFNFTIPNVSAEPVRLQVSYASNSRTTGNLFRLKKGSSILGQMTMPHSGSYFQRGVLNCADSTPTSSLNLSIEINRLNPNVVTYLDRILINAQRGLVLTGSQLNFRVSKWSSFSNIASYQIGNINTNTFVWDISNRHIPTAIPLLAQGSQGTFRVASGYREYVVANGSSYFSPERVGSVAFQDLHQLPQADYLIVSHPDFLTQANRLADLHRTNGLTVHVVQPQSIYNEFSSGMQDPAAIRRFVKMFYDRAIQTDPTTKPKYVLLFGDGTYDPKNRLPNNNNFIVTYQMQASENMIDAMVVDDFFGILDDAEAISAADMMDIGVGRLIVSTSLQAKQMVDKIEHYMKNGSNFLSRGKFLLHGNSNR